jgi:hypothetical protein
VNADTLALLDRPYLEVVNDLLVAMVGGVVNEPILFDATTTRYRLAEPARDVRNVTGTAALQPYTFQPEVDFAFSADDNALVWQEGARQPDDDTTFFVDYLRRDSRSPLTDINVGSVTRTLAEAIGREITTVLQQVKAAYLAGFVDTATGSSLDHVVAILGLERRSAEFAEGLVTFFRAPEVQGGITVAAGTVLLTTAGDKRFQTTETRTMQRGQGRLDVPVRAEEPGEAGKVPAGAITTAAEEIAGVARIANLEGTVLGAAAETDEQLRDRATAALRALGKATVAALGDAVARQRAKLAEVWDPNGPPGRQADPGDVVLLIESEPERFPGVRAAVEQTRAAGVRATLVGRYVFLTPRVTGRVAAGMSAAGQAKLIGEVIDALQGYVDGLQAGQPAAGSALLGAINSVADVHDAKLADVLTSRADVQRPGPEALVDTLLGAIAAAPAGDQAALRAALAQVLADATPPAPSARRIPDRDLVTDPTGQRRATDEEIQSGKFQVVAVVDGEPWSVFLDMEPSDVVLVQGG